VRGYNYEEGATCPLSGWPEFHILRLNRSFFSFNIHSFLDFTSDFSFSLALKKPEFFKVEIIYFSSILHLQMRNSGPPVT
jgi:hypothetical protein